MCFDVTGDPADNQELLHKPEAKPSIEKRKLDVLYPNTGWDIVVAGGFENFGSGEVENLSIERPCE